MPPMQLLVERQIEAVYDKDSMEGLGFIFYDDLQPELYFYQCPLYI